MGVVKPFFKRLKRFLPKRKLQFPIDRIESSEDYYSSEVSLDITEDYQSDSSDSDIDIDNDEENTEQSQIIGEENLSIHPSDDNISLPEKQIQNINDETIVEADNLELPHIVDVQDREVSILPPLPIDSERKQNISGQKRTFADIEEEEEKLEELRIPPTKKQRIRFQFIRALKSVFKRK